MKVRDRWIAFDVAREWAEVILAERVPKHYIVATKIGGVPVFI